MTERSCITPGGLKMMRAGFRALSIIRHPHDHGHDKAGKDIVKELIIALAAGAWLAFWFTALIVGNQTRLNRDAFWQTEMIVRGYAHYNADHSWHWNVEKARATPAMEGE